MARDYWFDQTWRKVSGPERLVVGTPRDRVKWSIISDGKWGSETGPVLIADNLHEDVAHYLTSLHNNALQAKK